MIWKRLLRVLVILAGTALLVWLAVLAIASQLYVWGLTHPGCPTGVENPSGYEGVILTTRDNLQIKGWWRPPTAPTTAAIILLGGNGAGRDTMLPEADLLGHHGYGVLTLDYRPCAGQPATLGFREIEELNTALVFVRAQPGVQHTGVLGFSVGGITAIRGAASSPEVEAIAAMGGYASLDSQVLQYPSPALSSRWVVQRLVLWLFRLNTGVAPDQISPIADLPGISPRPVLLVFGEQELERCAGREQFAAARPPKELWVVPGAGHGNYLQVDPGGFETHVVDFFDRWLGQSLLPDPDKN
jgi:hypothetical protein